jgi:hypothetical protein
MKEEIKTSKTLGYIFAIGCSIPTVIAIMAALNGNNFLFVLPFFLFGAYVGFSLIKNPRVLVTVEKENITLHQGSIWANSGDVVIPKEKIEDMGIRRIRVNKGICSFLSISLSEEVEISDKGKRIIKLHTRMNELKNDPSTIINWPLNWPEGGADRLLEKLKVLTSREWQRQSRATS